MNQAKIKRSRAIIITDNKTISMYRKFDDRTFYVSPAEE